MKAPAPSEQPTNSYEDLQNRLSYLETALEQSNLLLISITYNLPQLTVVLAEDSGAVLYTNFLASVVSESNDHFFEQLALELPNAKTTVPGQAVEFVSKGEKKKLYYSMTSYPLLWEKKSARAFLLRDISADKRRGSQKGLQNALRNVSNRLSGMMNLNKWLDSNREFTLCLANIDNLRYVNDSYGRDEGDQLILQVAASLSTFSPDTALSRTGGDEFMMLIPGFTTEQVDHRMAEICAHVQKEIQNKPYYCNISYGVVEIDKSNAEPASYLLSIADERMQEAKLNNKKKRLLTQ